MKSLVLLMMAILLVNVSYGSTGAEQLAADRDVAKRIGEALSSQGCETLNNAKAKLLEIHEEAPKKKEDSKDGVREA